MIKCLQLGAGHSPHKRKRLISEMTDGPIEWTTVDNNPETKPDVTFNLRNIEKAASGVMLATGYPTSMLPFPKDTFDELHMYSVIGLYGRQGDADGFFRGMRELWRILKPGGLFVGGTVAHNDRWAWGEPSAKRVVNDATLKYLTREMYQGMGGNAQSDYRSKVDPCWWEFLYSQYDGSIGDCQTYHWVLAKEKK